MFFETDNNGAKLLKNMHVRNTHAHLFTQTTFFMSFFYANYPQGCQFLHIYYFHSVGVVPVSRVKIWEKTRRDEKPQRSAMS